MQGQTIMIDKLLATFWLLLMAGFMGIVAWFVNEPALWTILVLCVAMVTYDFVSSNRRKDS